MPEVKLSVSTETLVAGGLLLALAISYPLIRSATSQTQVGKASASASSSSSSSTGSSSSSSKKSKSKSKNKKAQTNIPGHLVSAQSESEPEESLATQARETVTKATEKAKEGIKSLASSTGAESATATETKSSTSTSKKNKKKKDSKSSSATPAESYSAAAAHKPSAKGEETVVSEGENEDGWETQTGNKRNAKSKTLAEKMTPKLRKTGVEDMLPPASEPARVMKITSQETGTAETPERDESAAETGDSTSGPLTPPGSASRFISDFSTESEAYLHDEDHQSGWTVPQVKKRDENEWEVPKRAYASAANGAQESGWQTVGSKSTVASTNRFASLNFSPSASGAIAKPKSSSSSSKQQVVEPTKLQKKNAAAAAAKKAAKSAAEEERLAKLAAYRREQEREKMSQQQRQKSGGASGSKSVGGGMSASVSANGKLIWE